MRVPAQAAATRSHWAKTNKVIMILIWTQHSYKVWRRLCLTDCRLPTTTITAAISLQSSRSTLRWWNLDHAGPDTTLLVPHPVAIYLVQVPVLANTVHLPLDPGNQAINRSPCQDLLEMYQRCVASGQLGVTMVQEIPLLNRTGMQELVVIVTRTGVGEVVWAIAETTGRRRRHITKSGLLSLGVVLRRKPGPVMTSPLVMESSPDTAVFHPVPFSHLPHQDCGVPSEGRNHQQ